MIEIRIVGIEDLIKFAKIVRGKEFDTEDLLKLRTVSNELNEAADKLIEAEVTATIEGA